MIFRPRIKLNKVTDISLDILKKYGINSLILDVDNTLSTYKGQVLTDGLEEWLNTMSNAGIKMTVLSNSFKKRVEPFANKIGLEFISLALKPLPTGFHRAVKALGSKKTETAIVGDQIFTDTVGGNMYGVVTILLDPIKPEKSMRFRFKRMLEKKIIKAYDIKNTEE